MAVTMDDEEIARFLAENINATVISINPSGMPLPTPVWYANQGAVIFFSTMRKLQKAKNLLRDPRCVVQVEAGLNYAELRAVIITGASEEASEDEATWFATENERKYAPYRTAPTAMPKSAKQHYDNPRVVFKITPTKIKTWDNRKLRFTE